MTHIPGRYAQALFEASESLGCTRETEADLPAVAQLAEQCSHYLNNPFVDNDEKVAALKDLLADKICPLTFEFIQLMIRRRHLRHLPAVVMAYEKLCDILYGILSIRLRVPFMPGPDTFERLWEKLVSVGMIPEKNADKIKIQYETEPDLIGGFIAQGNGMIIDASIRSVLSKLSHPDRVR